MHKLFSHSFVKILPYPNYKYSIKEIVCQAMPDIVTTDYENLWATFFAYGKDYIGWAMALVFVLVLAIMIYEWFRFKP